MLINIVPHMLKLPLTCSTIVSRGRGLLFWELWHLGLFYQSLECQSCLYMGTKHSNQFTCRWYISLQVLWLSWFLIIFDQITSYEIEKKNSWSVISDPSCMNQLKWNFTHIHILLFLGNAPEKWSAKIDCSVHRLMAGLLMILNVSPFLKMLV